MQFARSGRPGVWYIATTPDRPKVREFDEGRVALVTLPTPAGGTINSNRVGIARAPFTLDKVADLFEQQIPGYLDGVTEDEQARIEAEIQSGNRLASYGIVRASLGCHNTAADIERLADALAAIVTSGPSARYRPAPEHETYDPIL